LAIDDPLQLLVDLVSGAKELVRLDSPSTPGNVVCAIWEVASMKS
jgi:hypothetical protein